jgi:hypothetical protein
MLVVSPTRPSVLPLALVQEEQHAALVLSDARPPRRVEVLMCPSVLLRFHLFFAQMARAQRILVSVNPPLVVLSTKTVLPQV